MIFLTLEHILIPIYFFVISTVIPDLSTRFVWLVICAKLLIRRIDGSIQIRSVDPAFYSLVGSGILAGKKRVLK